MTTDKENSNPLKIPENASDRDDFIQGFGKSEAAAMLFSILGTIIAVCVFVNIGLSIQVGILMAFSMLAVTFTVIKRDRINENMIDKIRIMLRYYKSPKVYLYHHFDNLMEGDKNEGNTYERK